MTKHGNCCSRTTAKQVQPLQDFIALLEKVLGEAHLTLEAQGDLSRHTQIPKKHTGDTFRKRKDTDRASRSSGSPEIASR